MAVWYPYVVLRVAVRLLSAATGSSWAKYQRCFQWFLEAATSQGGWFPFAGRGWRVLGGKWSRWCGNRSLYVLKGFPHPWGVEQLASQCVPPHTRRTLAHEGPHLPLTVSWPRLVLLNIRKMRQYGVHVIKKSLKRSGEVVIAYV